MTQRSAAASSRTLARPVRRVTRASPPVRRPSTVWTAFLAAAAAALAGLAVTSAVVLVGWGLSGSGASAGTALRFGAEAYLLAHHGRLQLPLGDISLAPMGLTLLPAWLLYRAGASVQRTLGFDPADGQDGGDPAGGGREGGGGDRGGGRSAGDSAGDSAVPIGTMEPATAVKAVLALAGSYAVLVVLATGLASTDAVQVEPVSTLVGAAVLAAVAGWCGLLRSSALTGRLLELLPSGVRLALRSALVALAVLLGAGALAGGGALVAHHQRAATLSHAVAPGMVGGVSLLLVGLLCVPNAAVWASAYALGPGFAVGTGTSVTAFGIALGPVPAFPLLAGLPSGGHPTAVGRLPLLAPLLAGVLAGFLVGRRYAAMPGLPVPADGPGEADQPRPDQPRADQPRADQPRADQPRADQPRADQPRPDWLPAAGWAAAGGVAAGIMLAALAALAGGSLGSGRMSALGPSPWQVGLAAAAELAVVAGTIAAMTVCAAERRRGSARLSAPGTAAGPRARSRQGPRGPQGPRPAAGSRIGGTREERATTRGQGPAPRAGGATTGGQVRRREQGSPRPRARDPRE